MIKEFSKTHWLWEMCWFPLATLLLRTNPKTNESSGC